jgi:predicted extracellular nuclease
MLIGLRAAFRAARSFSSCGVHFLMSPRLPVAAGLIGLLSVVAFSCAAAEGVVPIGQIQGRGASSPLDGREVAIEGVVTADTRVGLAGLFVQDEGDGDDATSDGVFVTGVADRSVAAGTRLRIVGRVAEVGAGGNATLTTLQVTQVEILAREQPLPVRVLHAPPSDWEALEGEHVRIEAPLTVAGSDRLSRYGELKLAFGGRLWQPSELAVAGTPAYAQVLTDNARRQLLLDDASNARDPAVVPYLPVGAELRSGETVTHVEGIVDQRYDGGYRLQVTAPLGLSKPQRPEPPHVRGDLHIASFNLENFFNGDGRDGGFPTPRGARTPAQYHAQLAKLVATIRPMQADVAALMELENDGYGPDSAIAALVNALNDGQGKAGDWRFVDAGNGPGDDAIRVGLIYRASKVTPVGKPATLTGEPFDRYSRVPLAQAFKARRGPAFVVVANHLKSKGCNGASGRDADQGDGQGCWNAMRTESVQRLQQWLQTDPTGAGTEYAVLLGDFNAYAMEDPIRALHAQGWQDAFAVAGVERPYSYVYNGLSGRLDHALVSPALARRVRGAAEWHVNADEADEQGYAGRNVPGPWRSSDHDPLVIGVSF